MEIAQLHPADVATARDSFIERLLGSVAAAFDVFALYLGDKLGFYEALAGAGSLTPAALAARTGTHERYVREWLEQQAVAGILAVEDETAPAGERRFYLPAGHDEVLADRESLNYLLPIAQSFVGAVAPIQHLLEAYRTGGGLRFEAFGRDMLEGQARMNRTLFLYELGQQWLPALPDVHARLQAGPPARIADIGCGAGWSSIGLALSYPNVRVDGYDLDEASIALARVQAEQAGVADRVRFHVRDAADAASDGYDLVTAFECVHDMSDPVGVLRTMRLLAGEAGTVLVVDEHVGEAFTAEAPLVDRIMYGWSILHCLAAGMADQPSAGTGTVMRPGTFRSYALEAGFRDVEVLPIDNLFFRIYRLHG